MIKKILLGIFVAFALVGCPGDSEVRDSKKDKDKVEVVTNAPAPTKVQTPEEIKNAALQEELEATNIRIEEAKKKGDVIARLTAEKEALKINVAISESNAKQWEQNAKSYSSQAADKDKELKEAKLDAWKEKLWWMAGICGLLAIVAGGIAWGFPLLRPIAIKASLILGAISGLMLFVAQSLGTIAWLLGLVPYILAVGGITAVVFGIIALRNWFKDHNSLKQTIEGIEPIKKNIKGFGDHMLKYVDGNMVNHIKTYKAKLKAKVAADAYKAQKPK